MIINVFDEIVNTDKIAFIYDYVDKSGISITRMHFAGEDYMQVRGKTKIEVLAEINLQIAGSK